MKVKMTFVTKNFEMEKELIEKGFYIHNSIIINDTSFIQTDVFLDVDYFDKKDISTTLIIEYLDANSIYGNYFVIAEEKEKEFGKKRTAHVYGNKNEFNYRKIVNFLNFGFDKAKETSNPNNSEWTIFRVGNKEK